MGVRDSGVGRVKQGPGGGDQGSGDKESGWRFRAAEIRVKAPWLEVMALGMGVKKEVGALGMGGTRHGDRSFPPLGLSSAT